MLGQWHHLAVTRSGSTYKFYVDGVQNGGDRFDANSVPVANAPLTLGQADALNAITGQLDEVQIFSRALSASEIAAVYNSSVQGFCTETPQALSAVSRKTHGSARRLRHPAAIDRRARSGMPQRQPKIVVTFNNVVTAGDASVSSGSAGSPTFAGRTMTISLIGVPNAQALTIGLSNIKDGFGQTLPSVVVPMNVLLGDVSGSGSVNATDIGRVKAESGSAVGPVNFVADLNADGAINATDIGMVKLAAGTVIP